jgi:hypothetical protein
MAWFECGSVAARRYRRTVVLEMIAFLVITWAVSHFVKVHNLSGIELYVLAALPSIPVLGVLFAMGIYLQEEEDEYERYITVHSLLWGAAAMVALSAFLSILRGFAGRDPAPPFTEFICFWLVMGAAKAWYDFQGRVKHHE